jgi:uncharacterized membrane protein YbaN (DUF454 family)
MTLDYYRIFYYVAKYKSFSKAAPKLRTTLFQTQRFGKPCTAPFRSARWIPTSAKHF